MRYALGAIVCLISFLAGATTSTILINWGRRRRASSEYATPLLLEAALLLGFGVLGANLEKHLVLFVPATVALLCYIMGLQNAMITKISRSEIRTTHVTGIVTDIGIELGRMFYWNSRRITAPPVGADYKKLTLLMGLLTSFFVGGLAGAIGFKSFGFITTIPLALILVILTSVPMWDDLFGRYQIPKK